MIETEFHDPERIKQLTALKALVNCNVSSTIQAHLWLCDVKQLTALVESAKILPSLVEAGFSGIEGDGKIIEKCKFVNFIPFHPVDLLMLYRDPTIPSNVYSTIRNSTATIFINSSTKTGNSTESIDFR